MVALATRPRRTIQTRIELSGDEYRQFLAMMHREGRAFSRALRELAPAAMAYLRGE
jgi:hypothetical protein